MNGELFVRSERNPLLTTKDLPYQANAVLNAGAVDLGDEVLLVVRVESCSGRSHLIVARSADGVNHWKFEDLALLHAKQGYPYENKGAEDCRVTWMDDLKVWCLTYTAYSDYGAAIALATTKDFKTVERLGLALPPDNKNGVLFPCKFDGLYALLHRPPAGGGNIWLSYSRDLHYWGNPQPVLVARGSPWWDGVRVGAGASPIETDAGWLLIYHGVKELVGDPIYRVGAALVDRDEPHKLIGRARRWLLTPTEPYERYGDAPNVVFPCGGFVRGDQLWIYYGAADSSICLAKANINDILDVVQAEPV